MFLFDNKYVKNEAIIDEFFDNQKLPFLERCCELDNQFFKSFFELCTESTVADAYEIFLETNTRDNFFRPHLNDIDKASADRFFKLIAIYHSIKTVRKKRNSLDWPDMQKALFHVYNFNTMEKNLTQTLYQCACTMDSLFIDVFAKTLARYLFSQKSITPFSLAFIENFCYNSYSNFMASFTRYLSINLRLKRAANF